MKFGLMKYLLFLGVFSISFLPCGCSEEMTLELKFIRPLKVEQSRSGQDLQLQISGVVMHSALGIKKIDTKISEGSLQVLVKLVLADTSAGIDGNLKYSLLVPSSINTVVFGEEKAVIWTR